ncbi:ketose-bisphosphate aldolase [Metabacillus herbersteinensis]|uniref:Ketose-bisphosphate aldolase n=1 Tax=Metabacillus herbersteinensis TaxID=283816 RepID=A0ABV6GN27_9BACI
MIKDTKEILLDAQKNNYAVSAFSVYNLETAQAAVTAAEKAKLPVILALGERYIQYLDLEVFAVMAKKIADKAKVPVGLHLDHAYKKESIILAIKYGFTSVMFDGSKLPFQENIQKTKEICELAHMAGVSVEAELGSISKGEHSDEEDGDNILTIPVLAKEFVEKTQIDFFAPAIGTVHGMYKGIPEIDLIRLKEIKDLITVPLVLHGGSGTPEDKLIQMINSGICKINVNTEISISAINFLKNHFESSFNEKKYCISQILIN